MTNQIFSAGRFSLYLKKFIYENAGRLGVNLAIIVMLPILFFVGIPFLTQCYSLSPNNFNTIADPMWGNEISFTCMFAIALSVAFGSAFYEPLKKKTSRISLFTTPVSSFEMFVTYFLIYIVAFTIISFGSIMLGDAIRVWIYSADATEGIKVGYMTPKMLFTLGNSVDLQLMGLSGDTMTDDNAIKLSFIFSMIVLGGAFFSMGSSVWPKNALLKSACFLFAFNMVSSYLLFLGFRVFLGGGFAVVPREFFNVNAYEASYWIAGISVALSIFMWWIGYARFKEWEVIKRW